MTSFDPRVITAAILAGGAATRLDGRDKGLEILAERPLIEHVVEAIKTQVGQLVICANRNVDIYERFAPVLRDDTDGYLGPLAGIATALRQCQTDWLLTVPVDSPRPPRDLAQRLLAALDSGHSIARVNDGKNLEPLFAIYSRSLAESARAALQRNVGVRHWQDEAGAIDVDFADVAEAFHNLNEPADFSNWEASNRE